MIRHTDIAAAIDRPALFAFLLLFLFVFLFFGCRQGPPPGIICGGGIEFECPNEMYCYFDEECGRLDATGLCVPRPADCSLEVKHVCGCDGKTYRNACIAAVNGVSLAHGGKCDDKGEDHDL